MKPRLFSTFRALQHENPLVSWRTLVLPGKPRLIAFQRVCHGQALSRACSVVCPNDEPLRMLRK